MIKVGTRAFSPMKSILSCQVIRLNIQLGWNGELRNVCPFGRVLMGLDPPDLNAFP